MNIHELDDFVTSYLECALWSSTDEDGQSLDDNFDLGNFADNAIRSAINDCNDFRQLSTKLLAESSLTPDSQGHDFWLTRNGHGSGFWDRGLGKVGEQLTADAKTFGSSDVYVGDDGKLYLS